MSDAPRDDELAQAQAVIRSRYLRLLAQIHRHLVVSAVIGMALVFGGGILLESGSGLGFIAALPLFVVGMFLLVSVRVRTFTESNDAFHRSKRKSGGRKGNT